MAKPSILKQIIEASKGRYSAILSINGEEVGNIVDIGESTDESRVVLREYGWFNRYIQLSKDDLLEFKITGYIFVGNLFGESKIKEGQKFRVKETGEIWGLAWPNGGNSGDTLELSSPDGNSSNTFDKSELEPYFE